VCSWAALCCYFALAFAGTLVAHLPPSLVIRSQKQQAAGPARAQQRTLRRLWAAIVEPEPIWSARRKWHSASGLVLMCSWPNAGPMARKLNTRQSSPANLSESIGGQSPANGNQWQPMAHSQQPPEME